MQDTITREITVKATKERVYRAITDPVQVVTWRYVGSRPATNL